MDFGLILMVLFGLLAISMLIIIIGMFVLGIRRIVKMSKPVEKQAPTKTATDENPPQK